MLLDEIKNIKSSDRELRLFGLTVGIVFALTGGLIFWKGRAGYYYFLILAVTLLLPALIRPSLLKLVQKVWMGVTLLMGWIMTRVLLGVIFYLVMTPISLIVRGTGKKFLSHEHLNDPNSYWLIRRMENKTKKDYQKQY